MSINIQQLINDTKKLSDRLREDEMISDMVISQAKNAQNQLTHMKQFSDEVEIQNEAASQRSQSVLVAGLQKENKHLCELQAENRELRAALDDYQNALELIMSKYRQQISKFMANPKPEVPPFYNDACSQTMLKQCQQIKEMQEVMRKAAAIDEEEDYRLRETISKLITENKGLREMVKIHRSFGGATPPMTELPVEESETVAEQE